MQKFDWVKQLVDAERQMEETGMVDLSFDPSDSKKLTELTHQYLRDLKEIFVEYATAFNNLKNSPMGGVKIYGISNTPADFMLFRNGAKLLFCALGPGRIAIGLQHQAPQFGLASGASASAQTSSGQEGAIEAIFGAFGELNWTYQGSKVNPEALVRYYLTRFVKESTK